LTFFSRECSTEIFANPRLYRANKNQDHFWFGSCSSRLRVQFGSSSIELWHISSSIRFSSFQNVGSSSARVRFCFHLYIPTVPTGGFSSALQLTSTTQAQVWKLYTKFYRTEHRKTPLAEESAVF